MVIDPNCPARKIQAAAGREQKLKSIRKSEVREITAKAYPN
jgi:hypothetical protein